MSAASESLPGFTSSAAADDAANTAASKATAKPSFWRLAAPAIVSAVTIVVLSIVVWWGADHPERFPSEAVYEWVMNLAVLARFGPVYLSGVIVWWVMRSRGASMGAAAAGIAVSPLTFGIVGALISLTAFPPLQAAYYITNPMVLAAIGSQVMWAAVAELAFRGRRGGSAALRPGVVAIALAAGVAGGLLFYVGVIWNGGKHVFYLWITVFTWLFGTGQ